MPVRIQGLQEAQQHPHASAAEGMATRGPESSGDERSRYGERATRRAEPPLRCVNTYKSPLKSEHRGTPLPEPPCG